MEKLKYHTASLQKQWQQLMTVRNKHLVIAVLALMPVISPIGSTLLINPIRRVFGQDVVHDMCGDLGTGLLGNSKYYLDNRTQPISP
ncbi:hypothetical protein A3F03_01375 [Candidatus Roizmanbacteria bacterium RIFCSPHIGHO2_12_FULL_41_11]|uniref:Uncharacterized protein n=2 Tax=Candidatus Roizmaniibacteriota TaxID=1752723 RepID=A0A1F7J7E3_9BACT|nr:MAG: hypothetical protein A3F03_01375 [Candidatus Roizmanbacteria bacterium RIFCSPHIGHO2_12_FULL_41_11]OGK51524.1 MAG: hypothetical protein A2966_01575 [Candidatus Roizmanbacteria bacterium RIFCSPLOWO2_01_FULL_41_22]